MNRGSFIKRILGLAAFSYLPVSKLIDTPQRKKLHFIGLGGGGCNALSLFKKKISAPDYTAIVTKDDAPYIASDIPTLILEDAKFNADSTRYGPVLHNGIFKKDVFNNESSYLNAETAVKGLLNPNKHYVFLTCLGGFTGTFILDSLLYYLARNKKQHTAICTMPFLYEGKLRKNRALGICHNHTGRNIHIVQSEAITERYGNIPFTQVFSYLDVALWNVWERIAQEV